MGQWADFLTEQDKDVFAASGYGARLELGDRPVLLVVDVTRAFCGERPEPILLSMKRWRNSCGERAWAALPHIQRLVRTARASDVPVIYTKGAPRPTDAFDRGRWADKNTRRADDPSDGDEIIADVAPTERDLVIEKRKPSAFFGTALASFLVSLRADTLIVCGTTTSGCVRATVTDAFSYEYRVAVAEEATFDRGEASHAIALFDMDMKYANVTQVDELVKYLEGLRKQRNAGNEV